MSKEEFLRALSDNGLTLDDKQIKQLDDYAAFLKEYNQKINLTGIDEYEDVLDKHFYDSLLLSFNFKLEGCFVDVGTGAGFPGVVLKICYPNLRVILLEPLKKRCVFLNELIEKLALKDIEVVNTRGEEYTTLHREEFDYVSARAVSNMNMLIEVCGGLVKKDGYFIALRGLNGQEELKSASKAIKEMGFVKESEKECFLFEGSKRYIAYLRKKSLTPKKYPRNYSIIVKKPL